VGGDVVTAYGPVQQSFGIEAHAGLSGSLDPILKNLRWTAGYDFLRYSDRFAKSEGGNTNFAENYNRATLGFAYRP
jgi:hypothetical protein